MARGRGNAYAAGMLLVMLGLQSCSLWHQASAVTYTVGGSQGWDVGIDYTAWTAGQTFKVGDILFFPYLQAQHNVVVVDKAGYDACSDSKATATFSEGNTNVTLSTTGAHYYLCSVIGHCAAGMKLAVTVAAAAASPTASPPPASAPTPSKTPSSTPITAPATAPASSTPSSAPSPSPLAPVPSVEAPASAPTPSSSVPSPTPSVGTPASPPSAPGSTPSPAGTPPSPPPPNTASSLLASVAIGPFIALWAALFV